MQSAGAVCTLHRLMTKRKRAERRASEREHQKLMRDVERLWKLEPGGSPEHPIALSSASEVEVHARGVHCPLCRGELRLLEHSAETMGAERLRVTKVVCSECRAERSIYFRIATPTLN